MKKGDWDGVFFLGAAPAKEFPMKYHVQIGEITIFKFMPVDVLKRISQFCEIRLLEKDKTLITYGAAMPGIFVVIEGSVEIWTENFAEKITTLGVGASIGEMSIMDPSPHASASVRAGTDGAKLIKCPREIFEKHVLSDQNAAFQFYRGLAELLSQRLRATDDLFNKKTEEIKGVLKEIMDNQGVVKHVTDISSSIDSLGGSMVQTLGNTIPAIDRFINDHGEIDTSVLKTSKEIIEKVVLNDLQYFDRLSQKLGLIAQLLENIRRSAQNQNMLDIQGDKKLLEDSNKPVAA